MDLLCPYFKESFHHVQHGIVSLHSMASKINFLAVANAEFIPSDNRQQFLCSENFQTLQRDGRCVMRLIDQEFIERSSNEVVKKKY
jgi:hypothetical protein